MGINCQIHDTCPYCGKYIPIGAVECRNCGKKLPDKICPYCGKSYHGFIGDPPVCPNCKHLL